jgi:hypothetical protein
MDDPPEMIGNRAAQGERSTFKMLILLLNTLLIGVGALLAPLETKNIPSVVPVWHGSCLCHCTSHRSDMP